MLARGIAQLCGLYIRMLDFVCCFLALDIIPWHAKLDNFGALLQADVAARTAAMIDMGGLRPWNKANKGGTASKVMQRLNGYTRALIAENESMLRQNGWLTCMRELCSAIEKVFDSRMMKQETWEYLVAVSICFPLLMYILLESLASCLISTEFVLSVLSCLSG